MQSWEEGENPLRILIKLKSQVISFQNFNWILNIKLHCEQIYMLPLLLLFVKKVFVILVAYSYIYECTCIQLITLNGD